SLLARHPHTSTCFPYTTLFRSGLSIPQIFLVVALLNIAVAAYIYTLVPEFLMRFLSWLLVSLLYRIRSQGLDQVPAHGPALLARSEEHTSELQSRENLVCRLLL